MRWVRGTHGCNWLLHCVSSQTGSSRNLEQLKPPVPPAVLWEERNEAERIQAQCLGHTWNVFTAHQPSPAQNTVHLLQGIFWCPSLQQPTDFGYKCFVIIAGGSFSDTGTCTICLYNRFVQSQSARCKSPPVCSKGKQHSNVRTSPYNTRAWQTTFQLCLQHPNAFDPHSKYMNTILVMENIKDHRVEGGDERSGSMAAMGR
ncbi:uncharacterized protein LOC113975220 isoform X1 [Neopelma chrysocephalum]|uniref:uncharacterized protein LOC113975220 isoform X1 n=1 Tax=Neopelma chrysocephalum TaxID=114329 RepID=UPI000FCD3AF4|nr:uncharacterized protein LOC113975220 isoform X1 [Neopelma chrysocephalum]